jgi:2-iminobutanoate/2-iminopropanoate deaminase
VYVTSVDMFPAVNEIYRRFFPKDTPARIFINIPYKSLTRLEGDE